MAKVHECAGFSHLEQLFHAENCMQPQLTTYLEYNTGKVKEAMPLIFAVLQTIRCQFPCCVNIGGDYGATDDLI